ncbi:AAA family ATPase [Sorangium atrum]|uniref:AAA family ATPase n=1 Tax=Sorangium atrum TaxID=2995308 RepID=A0ABT5CKK1_9BACT|nr:AAA family ATPase [Sorangium aterium]MDC0685611.1 AAA family ATPase [Sorangium aterium]
MLKLTRFQVMGFRSVQDSGWIETDTVTSLIGVNESGKTNLLLPLWKLNPAKDGAIVPLADFPRSEYSELRQVSQDRAFIYADFETDAELAIALADLTGISVDHFNVVRFTCRFDGQRHVTFPNAEPPRSVPAVDVRELLANVRGKIEKESGENVRRASMTTAIDGALRILADVDLVDRDALSNVSASLSEVALPETTSTSLSACWMALVEGIDDTMKRISMSHPNEREDARNLALKRLPAFVYYSNYGNLDSEIYLPHVIQNMKREGLGAKEEAKARTLKVLFDFVKLKPEEILELGKAAATAGAPKPSQEAITAAAERTKERSVLLQSASSRLTKEFRAWWKQGNYRFRFEADGDHFRIWVSDDKRPEEVELESRSTGLQWFLSFFLVFLVESSDAHENAILLLDEPGLSLHPLAQKDLSAFFDNLSRTNQLLYTTHSPFLVDPDRLDRVRAVYVDANGATAVSADLRAGKSTSSEAKSVYAVHAALGLSASNALLHGCTNVIVEGSSDQHYMSGIKTVLIGLGRINPQREIIFHPGGGAKGVAAIVPIITARDEAPPYVILDSDGPGIDFAKKLRSGPIYAGDAGKRITNIGDVLGGLQGAEVEDLMPHNLIVDAVSRTYRGEDEDFRDVAVEGKPIVPQVEAYASKHGITLDQGWKVELAKTVKARLLKTRELSPAIIDLWAKLFEPFSSPVDAVAGTKR